MDAAAQGADFDDLHKVMSIPLKPITYDPSLRGTTRRLLHELVDDGLVVRDGSRYRLAEIADNELRDAILYLPLAFNE